MKVIGIGTAAVDYFFKVDKKFLKKFDLKEEDDVSFEEKKTNEKEILDRMKKLEEGNQEKLQYIYLVLS